jgi:hypothetical protein
MPSIIQGTEVSTFEPSSTPGMQLESSAVSISEHNPPYEQPSPDGVSIQEDIDFPQPTPLEITGKLHRYANMLSLEAPASTSEQSSQQSLLKGKTWFVFPSSPALTL